MSTHASQTEHPNSKSHHRTTSANPAVPSAPNSPNQPVSVSAAANGSTSPTFSSNASQSVTYTPTPGTPASSLSNLDTFIHALHQELDYSSNPPIICSVKQNQEPVSGHHGPLEQRLEKKMNVQLSATLPAANQRIKLPVPPATFTSGVSEPKPLFLSLVIAGETTRRIFGGVGLYHPNQPTSDLLNITVGSGFSPVVCVTPERTVCIGFKFATYPRKCDPSEEAFRVVATIHDCDGRLVTYCLSAFAYSVKSHPRNSMRSLRASIRSRMKRRSALSISPLTPITTDHALPSIPFAAGSSGPPQIGESANIGDLAPLVHGPHDLSLLSPPEGYQPTPMLVEVVPSSCTRPGGITVSLFVNNLPQDGPIYARFGSTVVDTVRKTPDVLICRVPPALYPCEVSVTLSHGNGPFDAPCGVSLCKFTYKYDEPSYYHLLLGY